MSARTPATVRRGLAAIAAAAAVALLAGVGPAAAQARSPASFRGTASGGWGTAQPVPGLAALNTGGFAQVGGLACTSAGNCTAGGPVTSDGLRPIGAFTTAEHHGTWSKPQPIPGLATLDTGGFATFTLACVSAGTCGGGGDYTDAAGHGQVYVVSQQHGIWGTAQAVPGLAALNGGGSAQLYVLSCGTPSGCGVGGYYTDSAGHLQAFVVTAGNGAWGTAEQVPGTATLNSGGFATTYAISCPAAGHCTAGGLYTTSTGTQQAFVASQS